MVTETKKPASKNHFNSVPTTGEKFTQPSLTIPDQTMSIQTILKRYAQGQPLEGQREPIFHGDEEYLPDLNRMDPVDRQQYIETQTENLNNLKARYMAEKKEKFQEEIEKKKKQREDKSDEQNQYEKDTKPFRQDSNNDDRLSDDELAIRNKERSKKR